MAVIGLVVEGLNDYPAMEAFASNILRPSVAEPILFRLLQPETDATTGKMGDGGWSRVVGWCKKYSGEKLQTFFTSVTEDEPACDAIIVQIDGDALEECAAHSNVSFEADASIAERTAALSKMIDEWLNAPERLKDQVAHALPHLHTESWIMAGIQPRAHEWERIPTKHILWALKAETGIRLLPPFYERMAREAASNHEEISQQCVTFEKFREHLLNAKIPVVAFAGNAGEQIAAI